MKYILSIVTVRFARGVLAIWLVTLLGICFSSPALAQEMELPVAIQIPLFLKVMTFDRQRSQESGTVLVVGIAFQSGFRLSAATKDEVDKALRGAGDRKIRVVMIDLDRDRLADALQLQHVTVLYVAPLRGFSIADIAMAAELAHATTVTGVPQYAEQGLSVSARLEGERPRLLINQAAARRSGANFSAELLKLAQVLL